MRPVYQTKRGDQGNCLQAAIASVLELPLVAVVDPIDGWTEEDGPWLEYANSRLQENGVALFYAPASRPPLGYCLRFGMGKTHPHVQVLHHGKLVHDPTEGPLEDMETVYGHLLVQWTV